MFVNAALSRLEFCGVHACIHISCIIILYIVYIQVVVCLNSNVLPTCITKKLAERFPSNKSPLVTWSAIMIQSEAMMS